MLRGPDDLAESHFKLLRAVANRALICSYCALNHALSPRLSTFLLSAADEFGKEVEIPMSQEEISQYLFVRRESVADALRELSSGGFIQTARTKIIVQNRDALLSRACSCYQSAASLITGEYNSWASLRWRSEVRV
jgi:hypothetical protein